MEGVQQEIDPKFDTGVLILISTSTIITILIGWHLWTKNAPKKISETPRADKVIVRVWTSKGNVRYPGRSFGHVTVELEMNGQCGSLQECSYISIGPGEKLDGSNKVKMYNIFSKHRPKYWETYEEDLKCEGRVPELTFQFHTLDAVAMQMQFKKYLTEKTTCWTLCKKLAIGDATNTKRELAINIFNYMFSKFLWLVSKLSIVTSLRDCTDSTHNQLPVNNIPLDEPHLVSCVSLAKEILLAGSFSKLVTRQDKIISSLNSSKVSTKYISKPISEHDVTTKLKSIVYMAEHGVSFLCLSPDVFGDLLMYAKENEMKLLPQSSNEARQFTQIVTLDDNTEKIFSTKEWLPTAKECKAGFPTHLVTILLTTVIVVVGINYYLL